MKVLIKLVTASELISYEAMSLAMTMATFDHSVQLQCNAHVAPLLLQPDNRIHGMLKSLDLYDIPPMWLDISELSKSLILPNDMAKQVVIYQQEHNTDDFDTILTF